jgi:sugar-specific transcriptional regulator TrmB
MRLDLAEALMVLGFSLNQARVYLTILQVGSPSVGEIADENSKLYRQDIYRILKTLEKKGLITKTLGVPVRAKAIPVKEALGNLVATEKEKALERTKHIESALKKTLNAINMLYETEKIPENDEAWFSLLTMEKEITNRADLLFEEAETDCDVNASLELLTLRAAKFRERFQNATNNGAKIRLIIEAPIKDKQINAAVERVRPDTNNFAAKLVTCKSPKPFMIIDRKEVWISTEKKQHPSGLPCVLLSNGKNMVNVYHERFERLWRRKKEPILNSAENAKACA